MKAVTECTNCHQDVNITESMIERHISDNKLVLTILVCPLCGTETVVQIDNNETLKLHQRELNLSRRIGQRQYLCGQPTEAQEKRRKELIDKILQARQELNSKYNHTSYQFEGKEHKLELHVPNMRFEKSEE